MALNAYINEFTNGRTLKDKCSVCKNILPSNFFTIPNDGTHDRDTHARIKENRMCTKRCMNFVIDGLNQKERDGMSQ